MKVKIFTFHDNTAPTSDRSEIENRINEFLATVKERDRTQSSTVTPTGARVTTITIGYLDRPKCERD